MTSKEEKIEKLITEDRIFEISETDKFLYLLCKGETNTTYDVIYFKEQDRWKCSCNNIRLTDCYHILAGQRLKENEDTKSDIEDIGDNSFTFDDSD